MDQAKLEVYFFGTLFLIVLAVVCYVFFPYAATIVTAAVFAVMAHPLHASIRRSAIKNEGLAAGLTTLICLIAVFIPLLIIGSMLLSEAQSVSTAIASGDVSSMRELVAPLRERIIKYIPEAANFNIDDLLNQGLTWLTHRIGGIFANTASAVLGFFVLLIAFYYFLKDGERFLHAAVALSPLDDSYDADIIKKLRLAINSIVTGTLVIALIQALLIGIGFALFNIANPVLWGTVGLFSALIPGVGTAVVIAPAVLYLFYFGNTAASLGLLVWGALIVGLVDNVIGPRLIGRGMSIHPLFILLAVLGGLSVFGASGFILGPLLLSLLVALAHTYTMITRKRRGALEVIQ